MILLSIIIPVYKTEQFFQQCVDSVLNQDYQNIEVILVNDGSPDESPALCNKYLEKDARVKVIHQQNQGLAAARNAGLYSATGNYLVHLDNDDWWNRKVSLKAIIKQIEKKPDAEMFLFNGLDYHPKYGLIKRNDQCDLLRFKDKSVEDIYKEMVKDGNIHEASYRKIFKRKFIVNNNLYFQDGLSIEDSEYTFRIMRCVDIIDIIDEDLIIYRSHRVGKMTNKYSFNDLNSMLMILQQSIDYWNSNVCKSERKNFELAQCAYLWCLILASYPHMNSSEKKIIKKKLQSLSYLSKYAISLKTKLTFRIFYLVGFALTSSLLDLYVSLNKRYRFFSKKV